MATWVDTCTISGVSPAQIGYSPRSQPNSSASCTPGIARVRRLVHVVVGVHQAGRDQVAACVDHFSGLAAQRRWQLAGRAQPFDLVVAHEQAGVFQFAAFGRVGVVERGDAGGVVDEQGRHVGVWQGAWRHCDSTPVGREPRCLSFFPTNGI